MKGEDFDFRLWKCEILWLIHSRESSIPHCPLRKVTCGYILRCDCELRAHFQTYVITKKTFHKEYHCSIILNYKKHIHCLQNHMNMRADETTLKFSLR